MHHSGLYGVIEGIPCSHNVIDGVMIINEVYPSTVIVCMDNDTATISRLEFTHNITMILTNYVLVVLMQQLLRCMSMLPRTHYII